MAPDAKYSFTEKKSGAREYIYKRGRQFQVEIDRDFPDTAPFSLLYWIGIKPIGHDFSRRISRNPIGSWEVHWNNQEYAA